jgi:hypothetical protein
MKILSKEKLILLILFMIFILNLERIVYLDVKCISL